MALTSTIPSARSALVSLFQAGLNGVQVSRSHPGDAMQPQSVWLGAVRGDSHNPLAGRPGRTIREENYAVDVWVNCADSGSDSSLAETDAFAVYANCENVLANNATLGVDGVVLATVGAFEMKLATDDARQGWSCLWKFEVAVEARLN